MTGVSLTGNFPGSIDLRIGRARLIEAYEVEATRRRTSAKIGNMGHEAGGRCVEDAIGRIMVPGRPVDDVIPNKSFALIWV